MTTRARRAQPYRPQSRASATPRGPAPESTRAEAAYLASAIEAGAVLVCRLVTGGEIRGRAEGHDRDSITLRPEGGVSLMLRKDKVKYYWAERPSAG